MYGGKHIILPITNIDNNSLNIKNIIPENISLNSSIYILNNIVYSNTDQLNSDTLDIIFQQYKENIVLVSKTEYKPDFSRFILKTYDTTDILSNKKNNIGYIFDNKTNTSSQEYYITNSNSIILLALHKTLIDFS